MQAVHTRAAPEHASSTPATSQPQAATGATERLSWSAAEPFAKHPSALRMLTPLIALAVSLVFLFGLTEFISVGGIRGLGLWPGAVFVGGELIAQEAWVVGNSKLGLAGMLLWCMVIWGAAALN